MVITQIGSLPYQDIESAVEYSLRHDIPFLPELLDRKESMLNYIKNPGVLVCLDLFKTRVRGNKTAKVQCVGPATLVVNGNYSASDAVARARAHIEAILSGLEVKDIILFLDEPAVNDADFDYLSLWDRIFDGFDVTKGVHCCGRLDWGKVFKYGKVDVVSFNASKTRIFNYVGYRSGKRIAWGVNAASSVSGYQRGDLITPTCGLGMRSVEECERTLERLIAIKDSILGRPEKVI